MKNDCYWRKRGERDRIFHCDHYRSIRKALDKTLSILHHEDIVLLRRTIGQFFVEYPNVVKQIAKGVHDGTHDGMCDSAKEIPRRGTSDFPNAETRCQTPNMLKICIHLISLVFQSYVTLNIIIHKS